MIIEGYNVTLTRISKEDTELIRQWRNLDHVRKFMEFRENISEEMQAEWYKKINNIHNLYFIILQKGIKKGVINAKNIDWKRKIFEVGLFMGYEKDIISVTPILATLCFFDVFFIKLGFEKIFMKIHHENIKAIHFDLSLGCQLIESEHTSEFNHYYLDRESYLKKSAGLREKAKDLTGSGEVVLKVGGEIIDSADKWQSLLLNV